MNKYVRYIFFYLLFFLLGCSIGYNQEKNKQLGSEQVKQHIESEIFNTIVAFFRHIWPQADFPYPPVRFIRHQGLVHIAIPSPLETFYHYPFSQEFIEEQLKSTDNLKRYIADDIITLTQHRIVTRSQGAVIQFNKGISVECVTYVVKRLTQVVK